MVWTTHLREPFLLDRKIERAVHRCIENEALRLRCPVLAVDGTDDHVHIVVKLHSTVAVARLAQAVKGVSSNFANDQLGFDGSFDWQNNYGAFSVSSSELPTVIAYVRNQKQHHALHSVVEEWEQTFELDDAP